MSKALRIYFIGLVLTVSGCTDHRLSPLSPLRLRLKSTVDQQNIKATTLYTYDKDNRQTSVSVTTDLIGELYKATISYDTQNQYKKIERTRRPFSRNIYFTYQTLPQGGKLVTEKTYFVSVPVETLYSTITYSLDANNHITNLTYAPAITTPGSDVSVKYYYTGENVTKVEIVNSSGVSQVSTYDYDEKINPFYGLLDMESESRYTDIAIRSYSRNNVIRTYFNGIGSGSIDYLYDSQGLPTLVSSGSRLHMNYEAY